MAIEVYNQKGTLGTVHLHVDKTATPFEIRLIVDKVYEDVEKIEYSVHARIHYEGFQHFIPYLYGVKIYDDASTSYNMAEITGYVNTYTYPSTVDLTPASFVIPKTDHELKILPYFKIGYYRYSTHGWGAYLWDSLDFLGQEFGELCLCDPNSAPVVEGVTVLYPDADFMYATNTMYPAMKPGYASRSLNQSVVFAGLDPVTKEKNMKNYGYEYCAITVPARSQLPIFVANDQRAFQQALGIWVYDSSRQPQRVESITVYDENKQPHTMLC